MIQDSQQRFLPGYEPMTLSSALAMTEQVRGALQVNMRGNADSIIAEYVGGDTTRIRLQEMRQLMALRDKHGSEIEPLIERLIEREVLQIDSGLASPNAAYHRTKRAIDRRNAPAVSAQQQRTILNNSGRIGSGLIVGLAGLGPALDDTLTPGECAEWARQLGATRARLERIIRLLKERAGNA
jgi:hypothetical protein